MPKPNIPQRITNMIAMISDPQELHRVLACLDSRVAKVFTDDPLIQRRLGDTGAMSDREVAATFPGPRQTHPHFASFDE